MSLAQHILGGESEPTRLVYGVVDAAGDVLVDNSTVAVTLRSLTPLIEDDYVAILVAGADRLVLGPVDAPSLIRSGRVFIDSALGGFTTLAETITNSAPVGVLLTASSMNTTSKYTPPVVFGSTDAEFTTKNPKQLALIVGEATSTYNDDSDSGMALVFAVTGTDEGTDPTPTEQMRLTASVALINPQIDSIGTYNATTASAANMHIASTGLMIRSTSSSRYKTDIEDLDEEAADRIFELRPVWYRSTATADRDDWSHYGFIAEEVADVDPRLVHWGEDEDGHLRPEGVQYDRLVPHLVSVIQRLEQRVAALESGHDQVVVA
jgi:Chaperone of endosialidase